MWDNNKDTPIYMLNFGQEDKPSRRRVILITAAILFILLAALSLLALGITLPIVLSTDKGPTSKTKNHLFDLYIGFLIKSLFKIKKKKVTYVVGTYAVLGAGPISTSNPVGSLTACESLCTSNSQCTFVTYTGTTCSLYGSGSQLTQFGGNQVTVAIKYVDGKSNVQIILGPG